MLSEAQRAVIDRHFPGGDYAAIFRRRIVRLLAEAGGEESVHALGVWANFSNPAAKVAELFSSDVNVIVRGGRVRLAGWLRAELGLAAAPCPDGPEPPTLPPDEPDDAEEGDRDSDRYTTVDPLAGVREAVGRARNVGPASVADSLAYLDWRRAHREVRPDRLVYHCD